MATADFEAMMHHFPDLEIGLTESSLREEGKRCRLGAFTNGVPERIFAWFQPIPLRGFYHEGSRLYTDLTVLLKKGPRPAPWLRPDVDGSWAVLWRELLLVEAEYVFDANIRRVEVGDFDPVRIRIALISSWIPAKQSTTSLT